MPMPKGLFEWRKRQKPGAIMKPSTFQRIEVGAKGADNPAAVAGAAYWKTARAKFRGGKSKIVERLRRKK